MPTPERMNKRKGAQDMKKLMEILGDKRELCRLLNEHKDMLKKVGIVVLVIVLGLVVSAVKNGGQEEAQAQETTVAAEEETAEVIYVDVGGEVNQPCNGCYCCGRRVDGEGGSDGYQSCSFCQRWRENFYSFAGRIRLRWTAFR